MSDCTKHKTLYKKTLLNIKKLIAQIPTLEGCQFILIYLFSNDTNAATLILTSCSVQRGNKIYVFYKVFSCL
jgi:hypothetical protein